MAAQSKQHEWLDQWTRYRETDDTIWLFDEWIWPATREIFRGKDVLEAGCGPGHHTSIIAEYARHVTAVDLNTAALARSQVGELRNVTFVEADLTHMDLGREFDVVICIGVIHHTDAPDSTFEILYRHCRSGGWVIVWTYSAEGNALMLSVVEPVRKAVLARAPRTVVNALAFAITGAIWPIVQTLYRLPLPFLPYWEYFSNARRLGVRRSAINVFDKLNAPQTIFTTREMAERWFSAERFTDISITPYCGVSWRLMGRKK